jgi:hypothetical protein
MGLGNGAAGRAGIPGVVVLGAGAAVGAGGDAGELVASGGRRRCGCGATRCGAASSTGVSRSGSVSRTASGARGSGVSVSAAALGSSATAEEPFELLDSLLWPPPAPPNIWRNFSATSSSTELE